MVTVNDYLARRDAEWVGQPLRFLGMSVGVVQNLGEQERREKFGVSWVFSDLLGRMDKYVLNFVGMFLFCDLKYIHNVAVGVGWHK